MSTNEKKETCESLVSKLKESNGVSKIGIGAMATFVLLSIPFYNDHFAEIGRMEAAEQKINYLEVRTESQQVFLESIDKKIDQLLDQQNSIISSLHSER